MRRWYRNLKIEGAIRRFIPGVRIQIPAAGWDPEPMILICELCGPFESRFLYQHPDHVEEMHELHLAEHMHREHGGEDPWGPVDLSES